MANERRINIRFSPERFDQLDEKRFRAKLTFQEIGVQLFDEWLTGERHVERPPERPAPDPLLEKLEMIRASGDKELIALVQKAIDASYGILKHSLTPEEIEHLRAATHSGTGMAARNRLSGRGRQGEPGEGKKGTRKTA